MAYEQRNNSGSVFENDRKEADTHPDYKGRAMINGVMYWVSLWVKEKNDGAEFFSLSFKEMDQQQAPAPQERRPVRRQQAPEPTRQLPRRSSSGFDDMDDDIPF